MKPSTSTRPEPALSDNALEVLKRRYLVKDAHGNVTETPAQLFRRVADFIAQGSQKEKDTTRADQFYASMANCQFMPNSPTLMNAGRPLGQLSACFVLPVEDSMESIFETLKHTALIHQSGGGTGFSFSRLRPAGDFVKSSMGVSSGPVSFMEVYNAATDAIKQGGTRRGANMGVLRIDHPDIETFISAKNDLRKITNFNISVAITDAFIEAVKNNSEFELLHPGTKQPTQSINARKLFDQIIGSAWQTGEPGLVFIDQINRMNPTPQAGEIEATNPCGEVPLLPYEACNLGSINLGCFVNKNSIDWDALKETVTLGVRFLDNVITQNKYPIPEIAEVVNANRKIGLGVMGWADALIALGIRYDSEQALQLATDVAAFIDYHGKRESVALAKLHGSFPNFKQSRYKNNNWNSERYHNIQTNTVTPKEWVQLDKDIHTHGLRNATVTCIAPTGTISIIAGASGGIEPLFSLVFERNIMDGTRLTEVHPQFEAALKNAGVKNPEAIYKNILATGSIQNLKDIPDALKKIYATAFDVSPEWHVKMQAAFQQFTDNAVSKTINFSESANRADVENAYWQAYELKLKGITVYRNNSRSNQPMTLSKMIAEEPEACSFTQSACLKCD